MKILLMVAIAVAGVRAWAAEGRLLERKMPVCIVPVVNTPALYFARARASEMFEKIGVSIEWLPDGCSHRVKGSDIMITLSYGTPPNQLGKELAYALPYEGTHIVVFCDRMKNLVERAKVPYLLAYVLVHEITHILEATDHHSESGIMKAQWDSRDYVDMSMMHLAFTKDDVHLIHRGWDERESRNRPVSSTVSPPSLP